MTLAEIVTVLSDLGIVGMLLLIIVTGVRGIWVFGWTYTAMVKERNEWKRIALESHQLLERTTDAVVHK